MLRETRPAAGAVRLWGGADTGEGTLGVKKQGDSTHMSDTNTANDGLDHLT